MLVIAAIIVARSLEGVGGAGAGVGKEGVSGVLSFGNGVRAHRGMSLGLATVVVTVSGAPIGRGAGDGAEDRQIGVVGVDSASVSMSV
jgi:hypothetical protein